MRIRNFLKNFVVFLPVISLFSFKAFSQNNFQKQYDVFNYSVKSSVLEKRIFYLLNEMENSPKIKNELSKDETLNSLYRQKIANWKNALNNCSDMQCLANAVQISDSENMVIENELGKLYRQSTPLQSFVHDKIRASHFYELSNSLPDSLLLVHAWNEEAAGFNHIAKAYLKHEDLTYAVIDSAKYSIQSKAYFDSVKALLKEEINHTSKGEVFFQPLLHLDLAILQFNGRNEAGRFEPAPAINLPAYKKAKSVDWNKYVYSTILVYGSGPGKETVHFSKENQMRCDSAVALFKKGLAPFLIVSGGFVHPFMTHHCEAIEMRNYMVNKCGVPSDAVIIEPYARHTTTNIRNANRILIENGFPLNKPVLGVSSKSHIDYITGEAFIKVFNRDIGFVPFTDMQRTAECEASCLPAMSSMQINSKEPLDP